MEIADGRFRSLSLGRFGLSAGSRLSLPPFRCVGQVLRTTHQPLSFLSLAPWPDILDFPPSLSNYFRLERGQLPIIYCSTTPQPPPKGKGHLLVLCVSFPWETF